MKKVIFMLMVMAGLQAVLVSCDNYETYGDKKDKERSAIREFISARGINVIDEEQFHAQGNTTDVTKNEYVYMNNSGVYMQIARQGTGQPIKDGENVKLYIRFKETSIFDTTTVVTNRYDAYDPDVMNVSRTGTTYTASFTYGVMLSSYSASVPSGWLVPLSYVNVDGPTPRLTTHVNLIVPHTQGHSVASSNVYPYYYELILQR